METILGWVLSGTYEFENHISATVNLSSTHVSKTSAQEIDINYDSCFQTFWQIESSETKTKSFSDYSKHVYFNSHKYETSLAWKKQCELIPDNNALCESRLHSLIKRLKRDPVALHEYDPILKKQESDGIIEEPPNTFKAAGTLHYLPHHPVIRTDKLTSRVRIVYDASAKSDGPSLMIVWKQGRTHYLKSFIFCCVFN